MTGLREILQVNVVAHLATFDKPGDEDAQRDVRAVVDRPVRLTEKRQRHLGRLDFEPLAFSCAGQINLYDLLVLAVHVTPSRVAFQSPSRTDALGSRWGASRAVGSRSRNACVAPRAPRSHPG